MSEKLKDNELENVSGAGGRLAVDFNGLARDNVDLAAISGRMRTNSELDNDKKDGLAAPFFTDAIKR